MIAAHPEASSRARASASSSPTAAKPHLADKGYDPTLGARPLRRAIQRLVEDPLSERLLYKEFRAGEIIVVDAEPDPETGEMAHHVPGHRGLRAAADRGAGRGRPHRNLTQPHELWNLTPACRA